MARAYKTVYLLIDIIKNANVCDEELLEELQDWLPPRAALEQVTEMGAISSSYSLPLQVEPLNENSDYNEGLVRGDVNNQVHTQSWNTR